MNLELFSLPGTYAVSVQDVKDEVHQTSTDEDNSVLPKVRDAAILAVETYLRRSLISRTLKLHLDAREISPLIYLWRPPVTAVASITANLQDDSQVVVAVTNYFLDAPGSRIVLKTYSGAVWPSVLRPIDSMIVEYTSGYGTKVTDIPETIKEAIILLASDYYEQPEDSKPGQLPDRIQTILYPFRNMRMS